jgi:hypothetical protein
LGQVRIVRKGGGLVQHTSLTTGIDRDGIRRINYFDEEWQLKDLQKDISGLFAKKLSPAIEGGCDRVFMMS